jgi:hypothetical protein
MGAERLWTLALAIGLFGCGYPSIVEAPVQEAQGEQVELVQVASVVEEEPEILEVEVTRAPPLVPIPPARPKDPYLGLRFDIEQERLALARRRAAGEDVTDDALAVMVKRLPQLIDSWKGTRWSYSGTTQVPKKGAIACGYFVSTVLEHAGFEVDRVDLARQASEQMIRSVVPDPQIERFHRSSREQVVKRVEQMGHGIYIVGLDTHVGFIVHEPGKKVNFCHSTRRNGKAGVVCEVATSSLSMKSRYTVLGKLGDPALLDAWLAEVDLPSARKHQPQASVLTKKPEAVAQAPTTLAP